MSRKKKSEHILTPYELEFVWAVPCRRDAADIIARITHLEWKHAEVLAPNGIRFLAHCRQALMGEGDACSF